MVTSGTQAPILNEFSTPGAGGTQLHPAARRHQFGAW
jgi:hypothetical protein